MLRGLESRENVKGQLRFDGGRKRSKRSGEHSEARGIHDNRSDCGRNVLI